jgi:hypothetical protein
MEHLLLFPVALLYALFDYVWYNAVIAPASRLAWWVFGRAVQAVVGLALLWYLLQHSLWAAFVAVIWQIMWVYDWLYYIWAIVLDRLFKTSRWGWEGSDTVDYVWSRSEVPHARWTFVGLLMAPYAPDPDSLKLQVYISIFWGVGVILWAWLVA